MNYEKEIEEISKSMNFAFLKEETEAANDLRHKGISLTHRMFADNANIEQIGVELNALAKDMVSFESQIVNFGILGFLYADIARTLLNLRAFESAIQYALAGVEVNQANEDNEGITANMRVLLDAACFMEANGQALRILVNNPDLNEPHIHQIIASQPTNNSADDNFEKLLLTNKRPKSLEFCVDKEKGTEERIVRTLMRQLGDTRATVMKYVEYAKQNNPDVI